MGNIDIRRPDIMVYVYMGEEYADIGSLMEAVMLDIDGYFGDSDLDLMIERNGGRLEAGGKEYRTAVSLRRGDPAAYRTFRAEAVADIADGVRRRVESGEVPTEVPYVQSVIEYG